jgi:AraC-like DNA-binding protein
MNLHKFLADVREYISQSGVHDGFQLCGVRNMGVMQTQHAKLNTCAVIDPLIGLVLQGQKTVQYGSRRVQYSAGDVLIVGQTLPTMSTVVNSTPDVPFIAAYVSIDMQIVRNLYSDIDGGRGTDNTAPALVAGTAEDELIDAMARLFRLRRDPVEEQALGAAALREVYFRVLRSKHGQSLQQLIHLDSKANQIAKAIAHIRKEYRSTIKAADLASIAGMSASIFYENFKQITANSPLQYQKDLRLHEAQQMLQQAQAPVSQIALAVGYESPAQFSREFSRKFGAAPKTFVGAQAS